MPMLVIKRDGTKQPVMFDKITARINQLCYGLDTMFVDPVEVAQKVCMGVRDQVTTVELDELAAETAAHLMTKHPDFGILAARIAVSNLHKETKGFMATIEALYKYVEPKTGEPAPLISAPVYQFIKDNQAAISGAIVKARDFNYDYFGFKTLERSYLLKLNGKIVERPQYMLMRVACGIHCGNVAKALETYQLMSEGFFTHASPTLFNAGTPNPQLSSCFLLTMQGDSIEGIYDTLKQCAQISKTAGGIGLSVHKIRATGSYIKGTNGTSNGLVPMLRVFDMTARYVDQGGGKRKGAFAIYLEPWHADIFDFLELRKNHGVDEHRARDLFYGLWVPDLFMKRVQENGKWSLMCPHECPGLADCWGTEFEKLYESYEAKGRFRKQVQARDVFRAVLESQEETGTPYMCFKDSANRKSNQQNLGTIRSSNLCTEIMEYTAPDEVAVCNLASIALPKFVKASGEFDHQKLFEITQIVIRNLNTVIDVNKYPVPEAKNSNMRHRPIGLGIQGLADTFCMMRLPYESAEAQQLNKDIFETLYFGACTASHQMAVEQGPYSTFKGSPMSQGKFQFDMWGVTPSSKRWDWAALRTSIMKDGVRNSLMIAPMPTASTAQILGNNESFEAFTSNLYVRRTLAGEFVCVSRHLLTELVRLRLWTPKMKNRLVKANGSVQNIPGIPDDVKRLYKTVWEMQGKTLIQMAADRGAYIDQSQSLNVHMKDCNTGKLTSLHFLAWKLGLKTGMYYLRTKAATDAIQFTVDEEALKEDSKTGAKLPLGRAPSMQELWAQESVDHTFSPRNFGGMSPGAAASPPVTPLPNKAKNASSWASATPLEKKSEVSPARDQQSTSASAAPVPAAGTPAADDVEAWRRKREAQKAAMVCSLENKDECLSCGS